jgi:hypothetical protein
MSCGGGRTGRADERGVGGAGGCAGLEAAVDPKAGPAGMAGDEGPEDKGRDGHGREHRVDELALAAKCADEAEAEERPWRHDGVVSAAGEDMDVVRNQLVDYGTDILQGVAVAAKRLAKMGVEGLAPEGTVVFSDLD